MRPLTTFPGALLAVVVASHASLTYAQSYQDELHGDWIGPYDLTPFICPEGGFCGKLREFAHAALIPKGPHAGKVLLFRFEGVCDPETLELWLFDPDSPNTISSIEYPTSMLEVNFFCCGMSWDREGNLLCAGGIEEDEDQNGNPIITDVSAYFYPDEIPATPGTLGQVVPPCIPPPVYDAPNVWSTSFSMQVPRWYPTVLTLLPEPIENTLVPDCAFPGGSAQVVFGGPPGAGSGCGSDLWEIVAPGETDWKCKMAPVSDTGIDQIYALLPSSDLPEPRLDSYPRTFQLSAAQKRRLLITGDTDTDKGNPPGAQDNVGENWVMEIPYSGGPTGWQENRSNPTVVDRSYHSAVLLHKLGTPLNDHDRVLVFGGGRWPFCFLECGDETLCPNLPLEAAHAEVEEFQPDPDNAQEGDWVTKISLTYSRMYPNAVVLPTGKIFVEGGRGVGSTDYRFTPELYDPGPSRQSSGSTVEMRPPNNAPGFTTPVPRTYHHLAILLPDARVLVAGGEKPGQFDPDSRYNFEIYSPPYLYQGKRPLVTNVNVGIDGAVDYGEEFEVTGKTRTGTVDSVVLLRPAALTHHFDPDQRYIELDWYVFLGNPNGPGNKVLKVTAPADDLGPEGYYMLFVIENDEDGDRIPSVAKFIRFEQQP